MTFSLCFEPCIVLSWVQMSVKPSKPTNLEFVKGKIFSDNALAINVNKSMHSIRPITEKPVRFLGRTISDSFLENISISSESIDYAAPSFTLFVLVSADIPDLHDHCC